MGWFDEQGIPGGSIAPIESGYAPQGGGWGGGRVFTDDERERMRQELMTRTGGQWGGEPGGGAKVPVMDAGMHNPGWGIERPAPQQIGDSIPTPGGGWGAVTYGGPVIGDPGPARDAAQGITPEQRAASDEAFRNRNTWGGSGELAGYPLPTQDFRRGGDPVPAPGPAYMPPPQEGTLGAVGGGSTAAAYGRGMVGGGNTIGTAARVGLGALSGMFGGGGGGGQYANFAERMRQGTGQAPTAALQSVSGYGGGRQLGGFAGGGGSMLRSPTGTTRQVARSDVPFYLQRGATEVR